MTDEELIERFGAMSARYAQIASDAEWSELKEITADICARLTRLKAVNEELVGALRAIKGDGNAQGTWMDSVLPLIARFETAARFGADAVHNGTGADAIAKLMRSMAERLDTACERADQALSRVEQGEK